MTHYARGRAFEWKARDDMAENGYEVIRAAGSKGTSKVDLIAIKPGELLFVQCKIKGVIEAAEWDRLVEVAAMVGAVPILAANGVNGRGVRYLKLLGPKRPRLQMKNQPVEVFHLDQIVRDLDGRDLG
jgi:Holliday junction resolvase